MYDIHLLLDDRPGSLARFGQAMGDAGVSLEGGGVFTTDGKYQTQAFINGTGPATGSAAGIALSPDGDQQFLYVADYGNSRVLVLDRKSLQVLYQLGAFGSAPGQFRCPHHVTADSKGNLYVVEVLPGNRAQRFAFKGLSATMPANALTPAQIASPNTPASLQSGGAGRGAGPAPPVCGRLRGRRRRRQPDRSGALLARRGGLH